MRSPIFHFFMAPTSRSFELRCGPSEKRSGSWFAPHTESATDAPTVSVASASMQSSARAGARQSLVFSATLSVVNMGPPGCAGVGPPAVIAVLASCRSGGNAGNSKINTLGHHRCENLAQTTNFQKFGGFGGVENRRSGFSLPVVIG